MFFSECYIYLPESDEFFFVACLLQTFFEGITFGILILTFLLSTYWFSGKLVIVETIFWCQQRKHWYFRCVCRKGKLAIIKCIRNLRKVCGFNLKLPNLLWHMSSKSSLKYKIFCSFFVTMDHDVHISAIMLTISSEIRLEIFKWFVSTYN